MNEAYLQLEYWKLSWILAWTLSNFLVLDLDLDNILRNFFFSIAICHSDHKTNIITEFTLKHSSRWYIINTMHIWQYCHIWLLQSDNGHHCWIHIKKWFQMIYNTCIFVGIAIYGHSNQATDITIEFTLKNSSGWYTTPLTLCLGCLESWPWHYI